MSTFVGQYALQGGTTGVTMVPPVGTQALDRAIIWTDNKLSSVTPATPAGWTLIGSVTVGTGADGVDTGPIRQTFWELDAAGALGTTAITLTGALNTLGGGMVYRPGAGEVFVPSTILSASDTSLDTSFVATMPSNHGFKVGDWCISVAALTNTNTNSGRAINIPGCSPASTPINSNSQSTGNHQYILTDHVQITSGTQSAAANTTVTAGTATTGGATHVRVSVVNNVSGTAAASMSVVAAAVGKRTVLGAAAATASMTAAAVGKRTVRAIAAASWAVATAATGRRTVRGTAATTVGFIAAATGRVPPPGIPGRVSGPSGALSGSVSRETIDLPGTIR